MRNPTKNYFEEFGGETSKKSMNKESLSSSFSHSESNSINSFRNTKHNLSKK